MALEKRTHRVSLDEVAAAALASKGIETGLWRLAVGMRFAGTTLDWEEQGARTKDSLPTAVIGFVDLALIEADGPGPLVYDASTGRLSTLTGSGEAEPSSVPSAGKRTAAKRAAAKRAAPGSRPKTKSGIAKG